MVLIFIWQHLPEKLRVEEKAKTPMINAVLTSGNLDREEPDICNVFFLVWCVLNKDRLADQIKENCSFISWGIVLSRWLHRVEDAWAEENLSKEAAKQMGLALGTNQYRIRWSLSHPEEEGLWWRGDKHSWKCDTEMVRGAHGISWSKTYSLGFLTCRFYKVETCFMLISAHPWLPSGA